MSEQNEREAGQYQQQQQRIEQLEKNLEFWKARVNKLAQDEDAQYKRAESLQAQLEVAVEALNKLSCGSCDCDGWEYCRNNFGSVADKSLNTINKMKGE